MEYGTLHEKDALGTLAATVLPTFFPNFCLIEEGCYVISGQNKDTLMVVSPDGSIRKCEADLETNSYTRSSAIAAVEVKCPFPKEGKTSLHYRLPHYYVCQCLAEMYALRTDTLVYLNWSPESSVALEVTFDDYLFGLIMSLVKNTYDNLSPKRTTDSPERIRLIKSEISRFVDSNVKFLAEVPSATIIGNHVSVGPVSLPYIFPEYSVYEYIDITSDDLGDVVKWGIEMIEQAYNIQRRKATEVMVWVLTHINRDTSTELPCSIPIAFGLKDYKLTSASMRNATYYVIEKCKEYGIEICTLSADGQWIQLMTRDAVGKPLTLLQHQKDVWAKVQKMNKLDICKEITAFNKVGETEPDILRTVYWEKENGVLWLSNFDLKASTIKTPKISRTRTLQGTLRRRKSNSNDQRESVPSSLLQDQVFSESGDSINDVMLCMKTEFAETESSQLQEIQNVDINETEGDLGESIDIANTFHHGQDDFIANVDYGLCCLTEKIEKTLRKNDNHSLTKEIIEAILLGEKALSTLTHRVIDNVILAVLDATNSDLTLRKSWKKDKKSIFLQDVLHGKGKTTTARKSVRKKNVPKLSKLCERVIRSNKMPKGVLNIAYATCIYEDEYKKIIDTQIKIPFPDANETDTTSDNIRFWYSFPEVYKDNVIGKSVDCSHNFTHLRVRSCTTGIANISPEAWTAVAKTNKTRLSTALVEDLIDKQSVPNARTNFSEEVEECMRLQGFGDAADLTSIIRNWYEACDAPGIGAIERVKYLTQMRKLLLNGVNFGEFPPPGRYINKIPLVTFEGILLDIDTKIQLHAITGPYNIRSVGSLAAETTVGVLQQLNPVSSVSIKARDVPGLIASVVEVMTCKLNPNRGFYMRTARRSGVYPTHEADPCSSLKKIQDDENKLIIRNHSFDKPARVGAKRKIRFGTISGPSVPARGALPVRQYHRKDESKILPSKRLGLDNTL